MAQYYRISGIITDSGTLNLSKLDLTAGGSTTSYGSVNISIYPDTTLDFDVGSDLAFEQLTFAGSSQSNFFRTYLVESSTDNISWTGLGKFGSAVFNGSGVDSTITSTNTGDVESILITQLIYSLDEVRGSVVIPNEEENLTKDFLGYHNFTTDVVDGGTHKISGTIKVKNTPDNIPVSRRVMLIEENSGRVVKQTWSNPITGAYSFDFVAQNHANKKYSVISFDYDNEYGAVIADGLATEPV